MEGLIVQLHLVQEKFALANIALFTFVIAWLFTEIWESIKGSIKFMKSHVATVTPGAKTEDP